MIRENGVRDLVEVEFDPATGTTGVAAAATRGSMRRARRTVTVNRAESPLTWLRARGLLDARRFEAGERLRADYEVAGLGPSVTMRWDGIRVDGGRGGGDATIAHVAAKRRFDAAVDAVGGGLNDILWRVVCAGERLPAAERALGWPSRAGRLVLDIALGRLADHYRLP